MTQSQEQALAVLQTRMAACRLCREAPQGTPLPHEPRPVFQLSGTARMLLAGQAPGTRVHASGRPFTDPSGDRLRAWLGIDTAVFYDAARVAILPMGFCFPGLDRHGGDLPPRRECAPQWRAAAMAAMPQVDLIVCLGVHAMRWHMGDLFAGAVDATVRTWREGLQRHPAVIGLPHPSWRNNGWLMANPWFEVEVLPALRAAVAVRL